MRTVAFMMIITAALARGASAQDAPKPPVAKRVEHLQVWHGRTFVDPYFWLREKTNPEVAAYLEAENAHTAAVTKPLMPFVDALYREMLARVKQADLDVPTREGAFHYYAKTLEGRQYPVHCRRAAAKDGAYDAAAPEQVLLDLNAMAEGRSFLSVATRRPSDDGTKLAYLVDATGFRQYVLRVRDLATGKDLPDTAERVTSVVWAADGATLFFTTEDATTKRADTLWRLTLGGKPERVFEEKDELFAIGVGRTKDKRYVVLGAQSTDTWDRLYLDAATPAEPFRRLFPREKGHKYEFEHKDGAFVVRTNKDAKQFRLVSVDPADPAPARWKEILAHRADVLLDDVQTFGSALVVAEKAAGLVRFRIRDDATGAWKDVAFPESVYAATATSTPEYASTAFRVRYESPVTPPTVFDVALATGARTELKREEVLGGYDPSKYVAERHWATARDGVKIPLTVVRRKDVPRNGTAPLWLYAYGSYGYGEAADFDRERISVLDRGVVHCTAHVRGGDEMGEPWHDDGMLMKKKNTFFDFVDAAEWLVREKFVAQDRIAIEGGSAGGLLMGAVVNLRPDLWRAVHASVPFVDVMNTMTDASLPLTVGEYLEWGDPNEKAAFDYMLSYSPYDNLKSGAYPSILVTTSFNDSQVMYWEPAKYVAKLRTLKTDANPLVLKTKMEPAGHGGASGRFDRIKDRAFEVGWVLSQLGVTK
jgi:oligopeptidase B